MCRMFTRQPMNGKWREDLTSHVEEYALGRKLTRAELKRFVKKNILTIDRKDRRSQ